MLANCISSLRLLMAPALVYLLWQELFLWSLLLMLGALISDVADGAVARKLNQVTNIGGLLDHGSDALLVLSGLTVFACLWRYSVGATHPRSHRIRSVCLGLWVAPTSAATRLIDRQAKRHDVFRVCCPFDCSRSVFSSSP